jgi:hypothetical protein
VAWFQRDARISEFAVEKTIKVFEKHGIHSKKVNAKGYDLELEDGRRVEVKFDTWIKKTGNLSCEWYSNEGLKTPGWVQHSDADIMVYMYDFDNAYVVDMKKLKDYIDHNFESLEKKYAYRKEHSALNVLLPIKAVPEIRLPKFEEMFGDFALLDSAI